MKNIMNIKNTVIYKRFTAPFRHLLFYFVRKDKYEFYTDEEVVDLIVNERKSLARLGDGEFGSIYRMTNPGFQEASPELSDRLKKVLFSNEKNLIVGIPYTGRYELYTEFTKKFCRALRTLFLREFRSLRSDHKYAYFGITRPYMDYEDKRKEIIEPRFNNLKRIWNNRKVVIIEGKYTKMGIGNDLFDNAKSVRRILCPSTNAFSRISKIEKEILKLPKGNLYLLALGPTATVISYDLTKKGYQMVDIGHLDVEYMWFKLGTKEKIKLDGKYVNEAGGMSNVDVKNDIKYEKSIIKIIE